MENSEIADIFSLLSKLMDIHGENSFKAKSYAIAAFTIDKLPIQLSDTPVEKIASIKGIGESSAKKIIELLETENLVALQEIVAKTPTGIIEMLQIKGLGPKKIQVIWKEMNIESIGELQYACQENRLKLYKGFGEKTQQAVLEKIDFYFKSQGHFLYAQVEQVEPQITNYLKKIFNENKVYLTGAFKRQLETIEKLEYVIVEKNEIIKQKMMSANPPSLLEETSDSLLYKLHNGLKILLYSGIENVFQKVFLTTNSPEFNEAFLQKFPAINFSKMQNYDDEIIFSQAGIHYIPPILRETPTILERAKNKLPNLIQVTDIKGIIHSHSTWSDGNNTIEEMVKAAIEKEFEYLVLSDHSKSAFYAQGLNEEKIAAQHAQIDELNLKYPNFKIFKSIESDILYDGSLDYSNSILQTFDLVIASVHSILNMTEEKAMQRLIAAIENPYTTILGHMTGRLLLSRKGYPVNHKKIIDACAANQVVVELNAHPSRLDMDWRHIEYALQKNVLISINPDAHSVEGYNDIKYGVLVAQKAMLTKEQNLSSMCLDEFNNFLSKK